MRRVDLVRAPHPGEEMRIMRRRFAVVPLALSLLVASAVSAAAANCKPENLDGLWVASPTDGQFPTCLIEVSRSGNMQRGRCFIGATERADTTVRGQLKLERNCRLTADLLIKSGSFKGRWQFRGFREFGNQNVLFKGFMFQQRRQVESLMFRLS